MISVYSIKRKPLVEIILDSFGSDCVFMLNVVAHKPKCLEQQRTIAPREALKMRRRTKADYMK